MPWRRKWQPTLVFLPGKFHGQRNVAGYSPRGQKESDADKHALIGPLIAVKEQIIIQKKNTRTFSTATAFNETH